MRILATDGITIVDSKIIGYARGLSAWEDKKLFESDAKCQWLYQTLKGVGSIKEPGSALLTPRMQRRKKKTLGLFTVSAQLSCSQDPGAEQSRRSRTDFGRNFKKGRSQLEIRTKGLLELARQQPTLISQDDMVRTTSICFAQIAPLAPLWFEPQSMHDSCHSSHSYVWMMRMRRMRMRRMRMRRMRRRISSGRMDGIRRSSSRFCVFYRRNL